MDGTKSIKALVVDDSAFNRAAISRMLAGDSGIEVAGTAIDGVDAIDKTLLEEAYIRRPAQYVQVVFPVSHHLQETLQCSSIRANGRIAHHHEAIRILQERIRQRTTQKSPI